MNKILFPKINEKKSVNIIWKKKKSGLEICSEYPVVVQILRGRNIKARYDKVSLSEKGAECCAVIRNLDQLELEVIDDWKVEENCIRLERKIKCIKSNGDAIRIHTQFRCTDHLATSFDDYQFVFPGAFYNKNDTDGDGQDDYLGTYDQDYRDDRNPSLAETCFATKSKTFLSLIRADIPRKDVTITRENINDRHFIYDSDIGSLGFSPSFHKSEEFIFRMDYPFYERNSFCLNVDGSEWAGYLQLKEGEERLVSYILFMGEAEDLTAASWNTSIFQMNRIMDTEVSLPFTLEEAMRYRRNLIFNSYREFPDKKGHPAGFFMHFSPRENYGKQNLLEYGFAGNQIMNCYAMLQTFKEWKNDEYRVRALKVIEFFIEHCIEDNGLPNGIYNVDEEQFVYWWTGVLFPFQYAKDRDELVDYLGEQVVDALMAVAEQLKGKKGNYIRTMTEGMYYLMLCFLEEAKNEVYHEDWLRAVERFGDKLIQIQNADGSWYRAYDMEGNAITEPVEWFGANEIERGSGSIFPIEVLHLLYRFTEKNKYRDAIDRAAGFILKSYVKDVLYLGGLNDTTHKKSVKIDAVGVMYAMRSLLMAYESVQEPRYLVGARDAARILASWTYLWDIPFAEETLLGRHGFKTTGWAGCDVIPGCSYVDDEFVEFVPDLLKIAEYCRDEKLVELAQIVTLGMHHGLSMPQNMYGYAMPGVQCEGYLTSLWLSDTEAKDFSGAVAKNKGDDNDTCNGLIAAQALYNLESLRDTYGTLDFGMIKRMIFR